jgi:hypothetical protein
MVATPNHEDPMTVMNTPLHAYPALKALCLTALLAFAPSVQAAPPDLTAPGNTDNCRTASTNVSVKVNAAWTSFETWAGDPAYGLTAGVNDELLADRDCHGLSNLIDPSSASKPQLLPDRVDSKPCYSGLP